MHGDLILTRSIGSHRYTDQKSKNCWQYHPRSDHHSKVACWGVLFDLLHRCSLLREHAAAKRIGFGINHEMFDFRLNRKKNLDLVICVPSGDLEPNTFLDLIDGYGIDLGAPECDILRGLPTLHASGVGQVLIALEAKACMTEHLKARPRLYDELASSFQTINGDTNSAIAAGIVTINLSETFISPLRNKHPLADSPAVETSHRQPDVSKRVYEKVRELPRRSNPSESGFDALGITLVSCANNGGPVETRSSFQDGTTVDHPLTYATLVERMAHLYAARFASI